MPIPKKLERTINKFAKRDRKIGRKFYPYTETPGDLKLYVLRENGRNGIKFDILAEIDAFGVDFNKFRDLTEFTVHRTRENFGKNQNETFYAVVIKSTHIAKSNGEIYRTNNGDGVQAFQFDFGYKVLASHQAQMTFSLADTEAP